MQPQTNLGPGAAASQMAGVTVTTMILIGIGVVLAILVIWWGAKKKRQRRAAEQEIVEQGGVRDGDGPIEEADVTPTAAQRPDTPATPARVESPGIAPSPPPIPQEASATPAPAAAPIEPTPPPPVTPAPPPLTSDTPPIVAAAPPSPVAPEPSPTMAAGDDLTQMKGVGPKLAARLNELGVTRYADIAALDSAAAEALDAQLGSFRGRLSRDRWIEQARYLAAGDRAGFEGEFGRL